MIACMEFKSLRVESSSFMKILFVLPGLHRYRRGAEVAFISIAAELAKSGNQVTLIGSGEPQRDAPYSYIRANCLPRELFEAFPTMPALRNEYAYEELSFVPALLWRYRPAEYDVTLTCSYPFTNWLLRRPSLGGKKPMHVFVTQNGDWPAYATNAEFRFFRCDGLVCTNPDFYERNCDRWKCKIIPNGADCTHFRPGPSHRQELGLPADRPIVLMVSALIPSKHVELGVEAAAHVPDAYLVVAGDGPLRDPIDALAAKLLPSRYKRISLPSAQMPQLYRSANVFMHLSADEAFGNVFVEAMACGIPIVARNLPRTRWIVGEDEYLFDAAGPEMIANFIERACHSPTSLRSSRAEKAARFAWPKIAQQYREFLKEVVSRQ